MAVPNQITLDNYPRGSVGWFPQGFFTPAGMPWRSSGGPPSPVPRDPELLWKNPTYTIPGILQAELRGYWISGIQPVKWRDVPGAIVAQSSFSTPLFDLRPDLRGSAGYLPDAQPIFRSSAYGSGAKCMAQFHGINTISDVNKVRVFSVEEAHVFDPSEVAGIQTKQDITEQFMDGGTDVILEWEPPGNPVRYWRVNLFIQQVAGLFAQHPILTVAGCCS